MGSTKLTGAMARRSTFLKANAQDAASQVALLVALEHLVGVTLPDKVKEVGCSACPAPRHLLHCHLHDSRCKLRLIDMGLSGKGVSIWLKAEVWMHSGAMRRPLVKLR